MTAGDSRIRTRKVEVYEVGNRRFNTEAEAVRHIAETDLLRWAAEQSLCVADKWTQAEVLDLLTREASVLSRILARLST